jgi:hypothetical protein
LGTTETKKGICILDLALVSLSEGSWIRKQMAEPEHVIKAAYQSNEVGGAGIAEGVAEEDLDRLGGGAAGGHHHIQQHVRHYAPVQVQRHLHTRGGKNIY